MYDTIVCCQFTVDRVVGYGVIQLDDLVPTITGPPRKMSSGICFKRRFTILKQTIFSGHSHKKALKANRYVLTLIVKSAEMLKPMPTFCFFQAE